MENDANRKYKKNNWYVASGCILLFLAIIVPSTIAGMKNSDVGVDIGVNVLNPVQSISDCEYDFFEYMSSDIVSKNIYTGEDRTTSLEEGYKVLLYILSLVSMDSNFIFFMLEFFTMLFVALFAYTLRDKTSIAFVLLIFMLVWWYLSFSMIRQSLAMAIGFFAIALFMRRKYIWSTIWLIIAISIHSSSLILLIVVALVSISQSKMSEKVKNYIYGLYAGLLVVGGLAFNALIKIISEHADALPQQYSKYFVNLVGIGTNGGALLITICFLLAAILAYMILKKKCRADWRLIVALLLTDLLFSLLSFKMEYLYRFGYYFDFMALFLLIPNLPLITKAKLGRMLIAGACVALLFGVWYRRVVLSNWANMSPYRSDVLHISRVITMEDKDG